MVEDNWRKGYMEEIKKIFRERRFLSYRKGFLKLEEFYIIERFIFNMEVYES